MATISKICGGDVHSRMATNSELPAKFSPVSKGISIALNPLRAACAPSSSANGITPTSKGSAARRPRNQSLRLSVAYACSCGEETAADSAVFKGGMCNI